jgi:hypothetical protein
MDPNTEVTQSKVLIDQLLKRLFEEEKKMILVGWPRKEVLRDQFSSLT